jgi:hypothetical protein
MTIPVIRNGKIVAVLYLGVEMKASDNKKFEHCKILLYRLIDSIISDLYKAFSNLWLEEYEPSYDVIRDRIKACVDRIIEKDAVEEIYLKSVFFERVTGKGDA